MKILIANYRYFISGGPERYMFNVADALTERGHEIIPFSIRYSKNSLSPYEKYFVSAPGDENQIYFRDQHFTIQSILKTFSRLFYAQDVEEAVQYLINDTHPKIAYVLQYIRKLSPALLVGLKKAGLPIVVRLSDYAMLCPASICYRDGHPCELCTKGNILPSVRYCCVKGSLPLSFTNAVVTLFHRSKHYFDLIDCFVTTTRFMYDMMRSAGYPADRLRIIPTFVDNEFFHPALSKQNQEIPFFLYVGRLDYDKGAHILLDAWQQLKKHYHGLPIQLKIVGTFGFGSAEYLEQLKSLGLPDVAFLGELDKNEVADLLRNAYLTITPSIWYDNLPNVILESYASGTAVIASNIGSFNECVVDNITGVLFEVGNAEDLMEKMEYVLGHPDQVARMSQAARNFALEKYSRETHLASLESLFESLVKNEHD
jgi:glycosyltransferase involved in cell wall biosynthesis